MNFAQLFAFIGQNPEFASQLDAMGIPAPNMGDIMKLGGPAPTPEPGALIPSIMPGAVPGMMPGAEIPAPAPSPMDAVLAGIQGGEGGGAAAGTPAAAPGVPGMGGNTALAALAGLKAFEPQKPVMSGGVTGGVEAPKIQAVRPGVPSVQALLAAALGGGGGKAIPGLGSLIRG